MTDLKKGLMFLIDSTASMSEWINALNGALPLLVRSIALTNVFDHLSIMTYGDYDYPKDSICEFSGFCDCTITSDVDKLQKFSQHIEARGGGGINEAWKTALLKIAETKYDGFLYIMHLTDAHPHTYKNLDPQGSMEKNTLGDNFNYVNLYADFIQKVEKFCYVCLTSNPHQLYCHFSQMSGGFVYNITDTTRTEIRKNISSALSTLLGLPGAVTNHHCINLDNVTIHSEIDVCNIEICLIKDTPAKNMLLSNAFLDIINKMKTDTIFQERVMVEMELIISTDLLALTVSPILGKFWREICKRRSDPRREKMLKLLKIHKNKLSSGDATIIDTWLTDSYNSEIEINHKLCKFMSKNATNGLIRFIPEDTKLLSQQIVQKLASTSKKDTQIIREILARMTIDKEYQHPIIALSDNNEESPLPINSIPLNLYTSKLFELLMHTVVPGTSLTRRYAAILALHIIQCDNILSGYARVYLEGIKGTWINWRRRYDDVAEIPECFSNHFLNLILHEKNSFALTPTELETANYYKSVSNLLKFYHNLEIKVHIIDSSSIDGFYPDHYINCPACKNDRPLSLIRPDGLCGYEAFDHQPLHSEIPVITSPVCIDKYIQVRCYGCGSIYARDANAVVDGYSKCYNCRYGLDPSPNVQCSVCKLKFVQFYKTEDGLPYGKCGACANGCDLRKLQKIEQLTWAPNVFNKYFPELCINLGFNVSAPVRNMALHEAILYITKCEPCVTKIPENILYGEKIVQNVAEIWTYLLQVMAGGEVELPECAVCFMELHPSMLVPACGRKGCSQRVCVACNKAWYGKNTVGSLIYPRAIQCQFCSRIPTPKTLEQVNCKLSALAHTESSFNPDLYYGWCRLCEKPYEVAERKCIRDPPVLINYECPCCVNKNSVMVFTKDCPECKTSIEKISGCNHIQCSSCHAHWCWECGIQCESSEATYKHMWDTHNRIYDNAHRHNYDNE